MEVWLYRRGEHPQSEFVTYGCKLGYVRSAAARLLRETARQSISQPSREEQRRNPWGRAAIAGSQFGKGGALLDRDTLQFAGEYQPMEETHETLRKIYKGRGRGHRRCAAGRLFRGSGADLEAWPPR